MAADAVAGETGSAEFGILGPLEVLRSGRAVPLGGPRQRAVLAMLLLEANRVVSMDRLAEDVWAGHPPEGWATTLQTYVFHLRRALEPDRLQGVAGDIVVTRGRGYLLRVDREHLDAALFQDGFTAGRAALQAGRYGEAAETLRRALDLWRSPVLADLADYAFTRPEAVRLEELRLAALEARIEADLALDRHDALTAELEQLVAGHPLRERLHGQLMLALYRCGRQADALAAYRRVRDLLAAELGIDPGEPLQRLHASVLAHDPALDWDGGRPAASENRAAGVGTPAPRPPAPRLTAGRRELDWVRRRARRLLAVGAALAVAAAVCIVAVARPWAGEPAGLPGNSVGLIDSAGGRVGAAVAMGSPDGLAYGDGSVWAVNGTGGTVSRIDPATHAVVQQVQVGVNPAAVTVTGGDVWVTNSGDGTVTRINAAAGRPRRDDPGRQHPGRHRQRAQRHLGRQSGRCHRRPDQSRDRRCRRDEAGYPGRGAPGRDRGRPERRLGRQRPGRHGDPDRPGHRPAQRPATRRRRARGHRGHHGRGMGGQLTRPHRGQARPGDRPGDFHHPRRGRARCDRRGQRRCVGKR